MASLIGGSRSSGGSLLRGGGAYPVSAAKKKKSKSIWDRGPLGFGGKVLSDLRNVAVSLPAGLYYTAKGPGLSAANIVSGRGTMKDVRELGRFGEQIGRSTYTDVRHPLRNPGYTLLTLSGLASVGAGSAARGAAAAGKAARVSGKAAKTKAITSGLAKRPKPGPRTFEYKGVEAQGLYSRSAALRGAQKLLDQARRRWPEAPIMGRPLARRVGFESAEVRRLQEAMARAPAHALAATGKKLSTGQQVALRVVAEGKPIPDRITFHSERLREAQGRSRRAHQRQIKLLNVARRYVNDGPTPSIKTTFPRLAELYGEARKVALEREQILQGVGRLGAESTTRRVAAPGRVIEGTEIRPRESIAPDIEGQMQLPLLTELVPEVFGGGEFRVPYTARRAGKSLAAPAVIGGSRSSVGVPQAPSTLTHEFTGGRLKSGIFRNETTRLVAESNVEAQRFGALLRGRAEIVRVARDAPETDHDIPVRLALLQGKAMPIVIGDIIERSEEGVKLTRAEKRALGQSYEGIRKELFPENADELRAQVREAGPLPGVRWVDRRTLGGLDRPNPLIGLRLQGPGGKVPLSIFDAINNASRFAILYLKPAYAVPNLLGNLALNLIQQGFAAPKNLANAARLNAKLGRETAAKIDTVMGEGVMGALSADTGIGAKATSVAASFWSRRVDRPFRRASFLHEAHKAGYRSPKAVKALVDDDAAIIPVARRANRSIIDYSRLGPIEKEMVRRLVFFYPWIKGATVYAGHFLGEHPLQAAAYGQIGEYGAEQIEEDFPGGVPSFAEGMFKFGDRRGFPTVINPASAAIFQTPASVGQAAAGFIRGDAGAAHELTSFATPSVSGALTAITGVDPFTKRQLPAGERGLRAILPELYGGLPQYQLGQRLTQDTSGRLYPTDRRDAIMQMLIGGLWPRPVNEAKLREFARREREGR